MAEILAFLVANKAVIVGIASGVLGLATLITGLTPSPKDDAVVAKIRDFLARFGFAQYSDAPGSLKLPGVAPSKPDAATFRERLDDK